jgi:hypothetical protein
VGWLRTLPGSVAVIYEVGRPATAWPVPDRGSHPVPGRGALEVAAPSRTAGKTGGAVRGGSDRVAQDGEVVPVEKRSGGPGSGRRGAAPRGGARHAGGRPLVERSLVRSLDDPYALRLQVGSWVARLNWSAFCKVCDVIKRHRAMDDNMQVGGEL